MAELSASVYQLLNQREVPLDVQGHIQQGQKSAFGQLALQEARRQRQAEEAVRAQLQQRYRAMGTAPASGMGAPGMSPQPGAVQETVNTPYSSDLQAMLSQYSQEGADVTPTPGARVLPAGGMPLDRGPGQAMGGAPAPATAQPPDRRPGQAPMARPSQDVLTPEVIRQVGMIDPAMAMKLEEHNFKRQGDRLEMHSKQNAMVAQVAQGILRTDTQAGYEQGLEQLRRMGIPVDHLPALYDRRMVQQAVDMTTDAATQLHLAQAQHQRAQAELEPRKLAFEERREQRIGAHQGTQEERFEKQRLETEQHNRAMEKIQRDTAERGWTAEQRQAEEARERARHNAALEENQRGTTERAKSDSVRQQENTLRDDFTKQTERHQIRSDFYGQLQAAAKDPTGQGDIAMIYSYMKMLDPGSTVLSGEYATAQNTGSIPERIWREYNQAVYGKKLEGLREKYLERATMLYDQSARDFAHTKHVFDERTKRAGGDPANVTQEMGSTARKTLSEADIAATIAAQEKAGTPKTRQQVIDAARQKGMAVPEK